MSFFQLLILSLIQGLTEFLPVSSSGHLVLVSKLTGWADQGIQLDVAMHMGTLLAVLIYYWRDIFAIAGAFLRWNDPAKKPERRLGYYIILGTIPAVLAGLLIHHFFPDDIRSVLMIIVTTIGFGLLMGYADQTGAFDRNIRDINWKSAFVIGCAQALALLHGTSRSGITMTAARFYGFKRVEAARFSFLLGIPAIAGAGVIELHDIIKTGGGMIWHDVAIAIGLSFIFGLLTIHVMLKALPRLGLMPFVNYRVLLGFFLIGYLAFGG